MKDKIMIGNKVQKIPKFPASKQYLKREKLDPSDILDAVELDWEQKWLQNVFELFEMFCLPGNILLLQFPDFQLK